MRSFSLDRTFAACVGLVALLNALSAASLPVLSRRPSVAAILVATTLLLVHAALYWYGERIRARVRFGAYAAVQAAAVFGIAISTVPRGVTIGLLMLLTVELVLIADARFAMPIVAGAIALFVVAELLTSGLYQATTSGVLLAITGTLAYATSVLLRHRSIPSAVVATVPPPPAEPTHVARLPELSMRET